jgi:hypothetical protein
MIKFEELTLDEIEEIETLLGVGIDAAFADGKPKARALKVFYYVGQKRSNPNFKFEDAGKLTQTEVISYLTGDSDPKA